jgi:DNA-binding NarL/FixJ family response regulator
VLREDIGLRTFAFYAQYQRSLDAAQAELTAAAFESAWQQGRTFPIEQAVADAHTIADEASHGTRRPESPTSIARYRLTEREQEILRLVADGRSNAEIATELYISHRTAQTHVGNLFAKLGVHSRAEAVDVAHRSGLLAGRNRPST